MKLTAYLPLFDQSQTDEIITLMQEHKINILLFESLFHLGGAEKITYEIFTRIDKKRFNTVVCTLYDPGPMGIPFKEYGFRFYHNLITTKYNFIFTFIKLVRIIKQESIDIIYLINQPITLFWGVIIAKVLGISVIPVVHNTVNSNEHIKLKIYKMLFPFADAIIAVADTQRDHLINNEHVSANKIKVVKNGVYINPSTDPADKLKKKLELNIPKNSFVVGIVSRLVYLKGIDVFIKAAAIALQKNNTLEFLIVAHGPDNNALQELAIQLKVINKIHFLGPRNDIRELLSVFDIAVLSSRTEALPMAILEYMAESKAIIASNVGSITDLIDDGINGFLVNPEQPEELANKIIELSENKSIRRAFQDAAREKVIKYFSLQKTIEETEKILFETVHCHNRQNRK